MSGVERQEQQMQIEMQRKEKRARTENECHARDGDCGAKQLHQTLRIHRSRGVRFLQRNMNSKLQDEQGMKSTHRQDCKSEGSKRVDEASYLRRECQ